MRAPRPRAYLRALGILALAAACSDTNVIGPANQLEVNNATDTFQWQVTALDKVSQTLTYTWTNTGTTANVNQASSLSGGSATLEVLDAAGTRVYNRSLGENGSFVTDAGSAGGWTVRVTLDKANGTVNFRLQKP